MTPRPWTGSPWTNVGTNGKNVPVGQAQKEGSSANIQEIPISIENVRPEGTEYKSVTSPSGEALGSNVLVRRSKLIRKYPQRYDPWFGANIECNSDTVASIVYMIQYGYININVDME